jgi:hypothetical protein
MRLRSGMLSRYLEGLCTHLRVAKQLGLATSELYLLAFLPMAHSERFNCMMYRHITLIGDFLIILPVQVQAGVTYSLLYISVLSTQCCCGTGSYGIYEYRIMFISSISLQTTVVVASIQLEMR